MPPPPDEEYFLLTLFGFLTLGVYLGEITNKACPHKQS